jgi:DNA transformation protein
MSDFAGHVADTLAPFGALTCKRMFGGFGVYHDGLMFALIADDVLYFRADAQSTVQFEARGLPRFEYYRGGRPVRLCYFAAPDEIFDDPDAAVQWAQLAWAAAQRSGRR